MAAPSEVFNLENQYLQYLNRVGLKLDKMHPVQKIETKRAFYGGMAQTLALIKDNLGDMSDKDAFDALDGMIEQIAAFWINEAN